MKIGIIGLGLIGGTIAKCLNKKHSISAYDISEDTLKYALDNSIIHNGYYDLKSFLNDNKIVFLCLYPDKIIDFFNTNFNLISTGTVFIEISGVKESIISELEKYIKSDIDIVFTHPVAGSEKVGVKFADDNIFKNANYVITPVVENADTNLDLAEKLAKDMGFSNISRITPKEHDSIIAYTSQLAHIISLSLINSIDTELDTKKFIGDSFRDLTRISEINEVLWNELFLANKDNLVEKIRKFKEKLDEFEDAISRNDQKRLKKLMIEAKAIKKNISKG